jgi:AcrR family transcriptional regulator
LSQNDEAFQRRRPRQARARATYDSILEAAVQVLERDGPRGLTTNRVAQRAGVSVGTLYQYFPDKAAILVAAARWALQRPQAAHHSLMAALVGLIETLMRGAAPADAGSSPRPARRAPRGDPSVARLAVAGLVGVLNWLGPVVLMAPARAVA